MRTHANNNCVINLRLAVDIVGKAIFHKFNTQPYTNN